MELFLHPILEWLTILIGIHNSRKKKALAKKTTLQMGSAEVPSISNDIRLDFCIVMECSCRPEASQTNEMEIQMMERYNLINFAQVKLLQYQNFVSAIFAIQT